MTEQNKAENQTNMTFNLVGQYARDVSLECPKPAFATESKKIALAMDIGVAVRSVAENAHETAVKIHCEGKTEDGVVCYIAEVEYAGIFEAVGFSNEQLLSVLSIDGAALVYPFARRVLMGLITDAGYRAPMMDLVNFHALFMQAQAQAAQQKEEAKEKASA